MDNGYRSIDFAVLREHPGFCFEMLWESESPAVVAGSYATSLDRRGAGDSCSMNMFRNCKRTLAHLVVLAAVILISNSFASAQGILTVTPGRTAATAAGIGVIGYTGDNAAATSATLALPSAVAYDASGNLYIADANNHVIREVTKATGSITTVAGTGAEGFSGDNGSAAAAQLDTPTGIALDASGNLYIADSHNQRIRKVSVGIITTIAGTGSAGFSGDSGAAVAAQLNLPSAVAVDSNGNVYIADTNNQRIRKISGGTITTIAGTGEQNYTGDNGSATAAALDSPTGVAVDSAENVYISDRHNQRIREVSTSGTITTLAGSGTPTFGGSFGGDGGAATAASLANPTGVSVDASGNVYIADTNNQRIRQVSSGAIASVAGTGEQGFAGDNGPSTGAVLDSPRSATPDLNGNLAIADTLNQRIRSGTVPTIAFGSQIVGLPTTGQPITLSNTGTAPITVSTIGFAGAFTAVSGGSCPSVPITLAARANCTMNIAYLPTAVGAASGSVTFSGTGVVTQSVLLTGGGTQASTTVTLVSNAATPFINQTIIFTSTVQPAGSGIPTGTVTFYAGGVSIGAPQTLANGSASITTTFATAGTYGITAVYSGDANYTGNTSAVLAQVVGDFSFTLASSGSVDQTVVPGQSSTFAFNVAPLNGPFTFPLALSATGLPPGATVTFTPATITLGASPTSFTMMVQTAPATARLERLYGVTTGTMAFVLLFVPFAHGRRRKMSPLLLVLVGFVGLLTMGAISGCGTNSGFFGQPQHSYTIKVIGTATGANGTTLQHETSVTLIVQ